MPVRKIYENKSEIDWFLVSSSVNVDNIEMEATDTVNSIVRACDTDVLHQNRIDDLHLAQNS